MSRERRRFYVTELAEDGNPRRLHVQRTKAAPSLGAIPRRERVLDVFSTDDELLATCVQMGSALGVAVAGTPLVGPVYLLVDDGRLYFSMGNDDGSYSTIGSGKESVSLFDSATRRWEVTASALSDATRRARPGRPARVYAVAC